MNEPLWMQLRPTTLDAYVGIENRKAILSVSKLERATVLLHGPYGTGKTTAALLIASERCGVPLRGPFEGILHHGDFGLGFWTYYMLGSNLDESDFRIGKGFIWASPGRKTLIIDEAQGIKPKAQDRLNSFVENPSGDIFTILCTTDPKALIPPLLSRCIKVPLLPFSGEERLELIERAWLACGKALPVKPDLLQETRRVQIGSARDLQNIVSNYCILGMTAARAVQAAMAVRS